MKKLFITLSIVLGLLGTVDANAGVLNTGGKSLVEQGRTAELNSWLTDICGATGSGTNYTISTTNAPKNNVGDVYFVSINDYWRGNKSNYSAYDQINLGVDDIIKVNPESKQETSSGTFYTHEAQDANKFFFIVRKDSRKSDSMYSSLAFSWYDEWSYVENTSQGWDALEPCWDKLKDGAPFPSPHNCDTSLETNHYITLNEKDDYTSPHYNFTAYLYVPFAKFKTGVTTEDTYEEGDTYFIQNNSYGYFPAISSLPDNSVFVLVNGQYVDIKTVDEYKNKYYKTEGNFWEEGIQTYKFAPAGSPIWGSANNQVPYVFFYDVDMNTPTAVKKTSISSEDECPYTVDLSWCTAFDKYASHEAQSATLYDGMKEHYILQRSYDMTNWVEVDSLVTKEQEGNNVKSAANKKYTDTGLQPFTEETKKLGYTVYYRVISVVQKTDGTEMSQTTSNVVSVLIPGTAPFKLELQSGGTSVFDPVNQKNTFTNTVVGTETPAHDEVVLAVGAKLQLVRTTTNEANVETETVVDEVEVTDASITLSALVAQIGDGGTFKESFVTDAGEAKDATYQLVLTVPGAQAPYYSNLAVIANAKAQNTTEAAHRSGTPDTETCATQELFHNVISFKPAMTGSGTGYYIYRDGEKVADVKDTGDGSTFRLYEVDGTTFIKEIKLGANGTLSVSDLVEADPIAPNEVVGQAGLSAEDAKVWGYAVAHYDDKGNTYGSAREGGQGFMATNAELVVALDASSSALVFGQDHVFLYQKETVAWAMNKTGYEDAKPVRFDIYRKAIGDVATFATAGYEKVGEVAAADNTTSYTFTTDIQKTKKSDLGIPAGLKTAQESDFQKYSFYVKAIITEENVAQNVAEKNSPAYAPAPQAGGILTGIEGVEMGEADVTVADGILTVKGVDGMVAIYSATGAMVASAQADGEVEIDATGLENGVYVVKAQNMKPTKILIK